MEAVRCGGEPPKRLLKNFINVIFPFYFFFCGSDVGMRRRPVALFTLKKRFPAETPKNVASETPKNVASETFSRRNVKT